MSPRAMLSLAMIRAGTATLIDVRPTEEYEQGHIAGAISGLPIEAAATSAP